MLCQYHGKNATAICKSCGKYICNDCQRYTGMRQLCPQCYINDLRAKSRRYDAKIKVTTAFSIFWGILATILWVALGVVVTQGRVEAIALVAPAPFTLIFAIFSISSINYRMKRSYTLDYLENKAHSFH